MKILLSNDDGVFSPGIKTLALALKGEHSVMISAPDAERSGAGHSFTSRMPLRAKRVELEGLKDVPAYAVSGTPADCVKLGMSNLFGLPDMVITGINMGGNTGTDTFYSGTVAAAMEAAIFGIRAIAVSNCSYVPHNFDACIYGMERAMELMQQHPELKILNVNAPDGFRYNTKGVRLTMLGEHIYPMDYTEKMDEAGETLYSANLGLVFIGGEDDDNDDRLTAKGYITITPLLTNITDKEALAALKTEWREG